MKKPDLTRRDLEDFHSVLRRAAERAERNKRTAEAERLAFEVANLAIELETGGADR